MPLPEARKGVEAGFQIFTSSSYEGTLAANPEKIIWSSIKYLCANDIVHDVLYNVHNIKKAKTRSIIANNIKLYIYHAYDFYEAANLSHTRTSPLFYYYSFLNLAKSLCEIRTPQFHRTSESYKHGLSWKPSRSYLVEMKTEFVSATTRGVWHALLEAVLGYSIKVPNPLQIKVKDLFSLCPEISIEFERTYHEETQLIDLEEPNVMVDPAANEVWLKFGISKDKLKSLNLSRPKLLNLIKTEDIAYKEVKSNDPDNWFFESAQPKKCDIKGKCIPFELFKPEIDAMNLYTHLFLGEIIYSIPNQRKLPIRMPQLIVLYTLIFWLGSLVRYDPHSIEDLQNSKFWVLIDGFINQSRIWLLELFEWYMYKSETTLLYVR